MEATKDDLGIPADVDVRRLHPWTLLQRFVISLPGFVILLVPVIRSPSGANWFNLGIAAIYGAVTLPLIYLQYHRFRYWITSSELVIHSGVFTRRRRNIPVERIQNIDIERKLLPRLLGTASVKVFTAGSSTSEGVLEYVSADEAGRIREVIRLYQRQSGAAQTDPVTAGPQIRTPADPHTRQVLGATTATRVPATGSEIEYEDDEIKESLVDLSVDQVMLCGAFRFSLLYIAIIFSFLQFVEPDPEQLADLLTRGRFQSLTQSIANSPWMAGSVAVIAAALLSWLSGIAVNLNKYYGFRLWKEKDKLHKRHGLLTISETTIPLKKIQALICRSNPVMNRFGWWALELQTMGLNIREQGHQVATPFSQEREIGDLSRDILSFSWPRSLRRVSKLTMRRMTIRYSLVVIVLSGIAAIAWKPAVYALVLLVVVPFWAWLHYRNHGFALTTDGLFIRRGVIRRLIWYIPVEKMHVFYSAESFFQRRLGLKTVYVDTAGASSMHFPTIVDIQSDLADALMNSLYKQFRVHDTGKPTDQTLDHAGNTGQDIVRQESSFALPVPEGQVQSSLSKQSTPAVPPS